MAPEIVASLRNLLDQLVNEVPGVTGALVASVDGFAIADYLPPRSSLAAPAPDPVNLAAMTSAMLGLSTRMVGTVGTDPIDHVAMSAPAGRVTMYRVANIAALTVLSGTEIEPATVDAAGQSTAQRVAELLRTPAGRPPPPPPPPPLPA